MANTSQTSADVLELLKADHEKVRSLLEEIQEQEGDERSSTLDTIYVEFMVHSDIEEQIVYPAYKEASEERHAKVDVAESLEEHTLAKTTLTEMMELDVGSIQFDAKLKLLKEMVEHHADEEEEKMFPDMRSVCSEDQLRELAQQMEDAKADLESQYT